MKTKIQAKHIDDVQFITLVESMQRAKAGVKHEFGAFPAFAYSTGKYDGVPWVNLSEICDALSEFPTKVVLAKFATLCRRGLLDGCPCGCRGDLQVTEAGARFVESRIQP